MYPYHKYLIPKGTPARNLNHLCGREGVAGGVGAWEPRKGGAGQGWC